MNPICTVCKVTMRRSFPANEYYCPKCGLVIEGFNLVPSYDKERGPFVQPWMANLPQTMPAHEWIGSRCRIRGMMHR